MQLYFLVKASHETLLPTGKCSASISSSISSKRSGNTYSRSPIEMVSEPFLSAVLIRYFSSSSRSSFFIFLIYHIMKRMYTSLSVILFQRCYHFPFSRSAIFFAQRAHASTCVRMGWRMRVVATFSQRRKTLQFVFFIIRSLYPRLSCMYKDLSVTLFQRSRAVGSFITRLHSTKKQNYTHKSVLRFLSMVE